MEARHSNVYVGNPGGTASKNSKNYRIAIPSTWARAIGITPEDKAVVLSFDGKQIIIEKAKVAKEE